MMEKVPRPTGVSIIAILEVVGGILSFLFGVVVVAVSSNFSTTLSQYYGSNAIYASIAGFVALLGGALAIGGLLAISIGYGMWTGKGWAWTLAVVLYALGLLLDLVTFATGGTYSGAIGLVVDAFLLWYLWRPNVRTFFGRRHSGPILDKLVKGDF
jgi:uncharacterized membrane protein (DUF2068 family)